MSKIDREEKNMCNKERIVIVAVLLVLVFSGCTPKATPAPTSEPAPTKTHDSRKMRIEEGEITSQALANNLLGDPATRKFNIYLPPGYGTSNQRYPVVYVLHWWTGNYNTALSAAIKLDNLIAKGKVKPMILVFPDASNKFGGSLYRSSPTIGDYETYIAKELVQQIDASYRTLPKSESRGVMGCSMGGWGAFHLALKYPDIFSVAAPISFGTFDYEHDSNWETGKQSFTFEPKQESDFSLLSEINQFNVALAAATAPNPENPPFYIDMPFELVNGKAQIVPEVFKKINDAINPLNEIRDYLAQPLRLRAMLITMDTNQGSTAENVAMDYDKRFDEALTKAGLDHQFTEVKASHCNYDVSPILEFMDANLVFE